MNASVYSAMNPHPTRGAATGSPSSRAVEASGIALSQGEGAGGVATRSIATLDSVETRDGHPPDCISP